MIPDLGPNYLQKLSADDTIRQRVKAAQIGLHAYVDILKTYFSHEITIEQRSAVGNVSGNRCESDCRSRGREFDPCQVPYFCGD